MSAALAGLVVGLGTIYGAAGVLFAAAFVTHGVARVDPLAAGTSLSFRLLIVPGTVVFWPLLLLRWTAGSMAPPIETNAHRRAAR